MAETDDLEPLDMDEYLVGEGRVEAEILGNHPELMELPDDEREMWIDLLW